MLLLLSIDCIKEVFTLTIHEQSLEMKTMHNKNLKYLNLVYFYKTETKEDIGHCNSTFKMGMDMFYYFISMFTLNRKQYVLAI